ncbi:hypothetical protein [Empedobacter sp.]|uniref:hypothetical protein n=1 Tax=Empedobacter sp. TaxID=1927715 RepID=UPI0028A581D9|nr:hypothetical protein [Empedobacter sp.]
MQTKQKNHSAKKSIYNFGRCLDVIQLFLTSSNGHSFAYLSDFVLVVLPQVYFNHWIGLRIIGKIIYG